MVLTGPQGIFKTTWLELLCPKDISRYLFTGYINPSSKDTLTIISEYWFLNIDDQLRALNKKDENEVKNLITVNNVKYRRPYDKYITEYPRLASFMASVNDRDFLTDPTGSRRFLPFEVESIDIKMAQSLDMGKVYAQALHLFKIEYRYWFSHKEVQELHEHNIAFEIHSNEEQLLKQQFEPVEDKNRANEHLQPAMIQAELERIYGTRLSSKKIGEALNKLGFIKWRKTINGRPTPVYAVNRK